MDEKTEGLLTAFFATIFIHFKKIVLSSDDMRAIDPPTPEEAKVAYKSDIEISTFAKIAVDGLDKLISLKKDQV